MYHLDRTEKTFVAGLAILILFLALVMINAVFGTATAYGEVYTASYSYCAQTNYGPKGISSCVRYATATEQRQNTRVNGLLWNYDSYRVVH